MIVFKENSLHFCIKLTNINIDNMSDLIWLFSGRIIC